MRLPGLMVCVVVACGGSTTPTTPKVPENATGNASGSTRTRDQVVNEAILAITAGNVEQLMALADPKGMFEYAISCKEGGEAELDAGHMATKLRGDFAKTIEATRGMRVEVVSIKNETRGWTSRRGRYGGSDRNATFVGKGGAVAKSCTARTDLLFHEVEARVRLTKGSDSREARVRFDLVHGGERWFLVKVPSDLGSDAGGAIAMVERFQKRMCECKDKACADQVNEDMTKWGTEMAKNADYRDEKPDPDMARRAADIMTKYTECMTKLMMAGAGNP